MPQNQELLEMKKVYTHPNYVYPSLYDDIAVVELGRRIVYDYEKVKICCYFFDLPLIIALISSLVTLPTAWTRGSRLTLTPSRLCRATVSLRMVLRLKSCLRQM